MTATQDGYDWPTPHEQPPVLAQPMAPYFREQLSPDDAQWLEQTRREMREAAEIAFCERLPPWQETMESVRRLREINALYLQTK